MCLYGYMWEVLSFRRIFHTQMFISFFYKKPANGEEQEEEEEDVSKLSERMDNSCQVMFPEEV